MLHVKLPRRCLAVSFPARRHALPRRRAVPFLPRLEALEGRWVPTTVTNLLDSGAGSIRQAILDTPSGGTVDFQSGLNGTITLIRGELTIAKNLTIAGPGADVVTVSGNHVSRVFNVVSMFTVSISGLTLTEGTSFVNGGAINNAGTLTVMACAIIGNSVTHTYGQGGGIYNTGTLTITNSTLSGNLAGNYGEGGGIYNGGTLAVTASTLSGNSTRNGTGGGIFNSRSATLTVIASTVRGNSAGVGGGINNDGTSAITASSLDGNSAVTSGGAIYTGGTLAVTTSTLRGNSAFSGGGVNNRGTLTVTASTFEENFTTSSSDSSSGGGIYNSGTLTVTISTFSRNFAVGGGGGILNTIGTLTITTSTFSGNAAAGGGAITNGSTATIAASTLSGNSATRSSGGIFNGGTLTVRNTIVAGNTAGVSPDVRGSVTSQGHNLIGEDTGGSGFHATDLVGTPENPIDPRLGPLGDYGGPTSTHALLADSPAINAGDNTDSPEFDQRGFGFARIIGGRTDIGSFERSVGPQIVRQSLTRTIGPVSSLRVTFDRAIDTASFTPEKIVLFLGPLGDLPVTAVSVVPGSADRQFNISFPAQVITGIYELHVGPYILDAAGVPMDHDPNGPPGESGDFYIAAFGIRGPRVLSSTPFGTVGSPVERVRLTFDVPMDPSSFEPRDVYYWVGPQGAVELGRIEVVPGSDNRQFDVVPASPLAAAGRYELAVWPNVRDVWGNPLDQDDDLIGGEGIDDGYLAVFDIARTGPGQGTGTGRGADTGIVAALLRDTVPRAVAERWHGMSEELQTPSSWE